MKSLDLFCGTKSFSKVAETFGFETYSLDILPKFEPTFCCNILDWDYKQYPKGYFNTIWASPNCKDYSSMNFLSGKEKDLTESNQLVEKVIEIIEYFEPDFWYLENPQSGKLKNQEFMEYLPYNDVDYCKYGFNYRKRTRIWTNNDNWTPQLLCKKNSFCDEKKKYAKHPNFRWITRGEGVSTKWEQRISIPQNLMIEILKSQFI